ncbi:AEC family transporter [Flavobacterium piscinae]|uniref:AEC family transporter n=1 Tax=Flavobacterium piscinae TaxID=2506424 RepID=UPI002AAB4567|nr:AEC family transporter [Flavobacterium piscinae]
MAWVVQKLTGCLILTGGLGNTSFVGFPVIEALFGQEGLQTAIIVDQPGSFVVLATLGVTVASVFSKGEVDSKAIIKKILFFPPFIAFVLACLLNFLNIDFPNMLQTVFQKVGGTVSTIALVSVGLQLKIDKKVNIGIFWRWDCSLN